MVTTPVVVFSGLGIPCERYSSLIKLIHTTAYVLKFVRILKSRLCGNKAEPSVGLLSLHDIDSAKTLLYRQFQSEFANDEKFESQKESLKIFEDKAGVLRCKGRIENSTLPYSAKFPVLLPRKHHFTNLVIWTAMSLSNIMEWEKRLLRYVQIIGLLMGDKQ